MNSIVGSINGNKNKLKIEISWKIAITYIIIIKLNARAIYVKSSQDLISLF